MNLSRRLFLGGLVTVTAAAMSPIRPATPILWGDGEHDDAPALNAWLRGEPVQIADGVGAWRGSHYLLQGGTFLLGSTLEVNRDMAVYNVTFLRDREFDGDFTLRVDRSGLGSWFRGVTVKSRYPDLIGGVQFMALPHNP